MQNFLFFFNGFHNIFVGSIVVANLKWICCSLTRVTATFYAVFLVVNIAKGRIISNSANFLNVSIYFLR